MNLPYSEKVDIGGLSRLFDNKSECYKLFWFKALLEYVCLGKTEISFEELVDEMISEAWYMVTEYHLNLGPRDTLEKVVKHIQITTGMKSSAKKEKIKEMLRIAEDPEIYRFKQILTNEVPFRIQAPFIEGDRAAVFRYSTNKRAELINMQKKAMYYYSSISGLQRKILVVPEWTEYIVENQEILRGWVEYNLIIYLQRRNPSVPGISDKLSPPQGRKLEKAKRYWRLIAENMDLHEIYRDTLMTNNNISIDHFVPWSYVAHDELWNLHPTTRGINSSKGNRLPDWNVYFPKLAALEYRAYLLMWKNDGVRSEFEECAKEHLNNQDVKRRLYKPGQEEAVFTRQLEDIVYPSYESAKMCGFFVWEGNI